MGAPRRYILRSSSELMRGSALCPYLLGLLAACAVTLASYRVSLSDCESCRVAPPSERQLDLWGDITTELEVRTPVSLLLGGEGSCAHLARELDRLGMTRGEFRRTAAYIMESLGRTPEPAVSSGSVIRQGIETLELPEGMQIPTVDQSAGSEPLMDEPRELQIARRLLRRLPVPDQRKMGR